MSKSFYIASATVEILDTIGEYRLVSAIQVPYFGEWAECKGDDTAKQSEQQTMQFDQQLMSIFQSQYANQTQVLNFLQTALKPMITNPTGYDANALAAMRTSASDTNAQQFQNAQEALNNQITQSSGGSKLTGVSGAAQQAKAALDIAGAQQEANTQNQITQADANLKQQNYWNAIGALSGVGSLISPTSYSGQAISGGNTVANLSQAYTQSQQSPLLGALGGAVGGATGALFGGTKPWLLGCWVAASFFGWNSLKTWVIRMWIALKAPAWFRNFYYAYGERISQTPLRWAFYPLFQAILQAA